MATTNVTVLCLHGRRVSVKVNPNTSILQIIEEACAKQKLNPDIYNVKHIKRILDSSSTVRYSNIPNNCLLELIEAKTPRRTSNVTVSILNDIGQQLTAEFPPSTTLLEILSHHESGDGSWLPSVGSGFTPVIVYAMRRITGDQLNDVSLRSLGLTGGRCMFRHSKEDCGASAPFLLSKAYLAQLPKRIIDNDDESVVSDVENSSGIPVSKRISENTELQESLNEMPLEIKDNEMCPVQNVDKIFLRETSSDHGVAMGDAFALTDTSNSSSAVCALTVNEVEEEAIEDSTCIMLGSHESILFHLDEVPTMKINEEDDKFFEVTAEEVRSLHREQMKIVQELAEAPLLTQNLRAMENDAKILRALNRHPITRLRVVFPDRHVIQAIFKPMDSVASVMEFLKLFLVDDKMEFTLHLRHPPSVLNPQASLVCADCIPNAQIYFVPLVPIDNYNYINTETMQKKSSYNAACRATKGNVMKTRGQSQQAIELKRNNFEYHENQPSRSASNDPPKWFKIGK